MTASSHSRVIRLRRVVACIALLMASVAGTSRVQAQDAVDDFLRYGDLVYAEAAQMPSDSGSAGRVDVMIRIAYDYLVFVRSGREHRDSTFKAGASVSIEIVDNRSLTVFAKDERTELYAPDFATTNTRDATVLFKQTAYLEPGDYTVAVTIDDAHSTRERRIPLPIRVRSASTGGMAILSVVPVSYRPSFDMPQLAALGYGGRFLFASPAFVGVSAAAPPGTDWTFRLKRVSEDGMLPVWSDTLPPLLGHDNLGGGRRNGVVGGFGFDMYSGRLSASMHVFQLPFDTLEVGDYSLDISAAGKDGSDVLTFPFSIFWKEMPLTLKQTDIALAIMRYILSEEDYSIMKKGNDEECMAKIRAYWKGRDPSPATPNNEAMVEFFRRADQAYYKFQTANVTNGALTDRGKIFILYGPPDSAERVLQPGGLPQEIWVYKLLGKTIRFVDRNRNGNLRLAQ
jgi:GWxTD domain-containing protein